MHRFLKMNSVIGDRKGIKNRACAMSDVTQWFNCVSSWARSDLQASHVLFFLQTRAHVDALPTNFCLLWGGKISVTCTRRWPTALPQASLWQTSPKDQTLFSAIIFSANDCTSSSFIFPPLPLLFLYWLLIDWYSRSTKCHPFPLIQKCASSPLLLPIQPSGACSVQKQAFSMLCSCRYHFPGFFTIQC